MSDPTSGLSADAVDLLLTLMEAPEAVLSGAALQDFYPDAGAALVNAGALKAAGHEPMTTGMADHDDLPVVVTWCPEVGGYAYFSSSAGWVKVDNEGLTRYRVDFDWFLRFIAAAVKVTGVWRWQCLVPEILWDLGDAWIGKRKATVLLGRRLSTSGTFDEICDALTRRVGRPPGVLLTTTRRLARHVRLPGQHRILALGDCLRGDGTGFHLDLDVIGGVFAGLLPQRTPQPIEASADFRIVSAKGETFAFRGDKQRQVIEYLHERWLDGVERVSIAEMMDDLGFPIETRLRDLFKKHPAWKKLLKEEGGSAWFDV